MNRVQPTVVAESQLQRALDCGELIRLYQPVIHLDTAHRGLGTASCGPDTLPEYFVGPGTYRWSWTLRTTTAD